jgi:hypothetical protein
MSRSLKLFVGQTAMLTGPGAAQTPTDQNAPVESRLPVAYVHVSEQTGIAAFAAAWDGKLNPSFRFPFSEDLKLVTRQLQQVSLWLRRR